MPRPRKKTLALPRHVNVVKTRYGEYYYFHVGRGTKAAGKSVRIPGCPHLPDGSLNLAWWETYRALAGEPAPASRPGTFSALIATFKSSAEWSDLAVSTRREWTRHLAYVEENWGPLRVAGLTPVGVRTLIDSRQTTPADANNLLRCTRRLLAWSVERGWIASNPARDVSLFKTGDAYAAWPWEIIEYFRDNVSRRDLWHVAAIALYTGQRKGDVLRMTVGDLVDDNGVMRVHVRQGKTKTRLRIHLHKALLELLPELEARRRQLMKVMPLDLKQVPLVVNQHGEAWTDGGFDTVWQTEMNRPEMQVLRTNRFVFHGLRKSAVVTMLEAGATEHEVMAVTGQSAKMVAHYAQQVNREKLSSKAILKWEAAERSR